MAVRTLKNDPDRGVCPRTYRARAVARLWLLNRSVDLTQNLLFRAFPEAEREEIARLAHIQDVRVGEVVFDSQDKRHVFFPLTGVISLLRALTDGSTIEIAMVGLDGLTSIDAALGLNMDPHEGVVQGEGRIARVDAAAVRELISRSSAAQMLMLRYLATMHSHTSQLAACNRAHVVGERLAHWLLLLHDRSMGDEMALTQEFLARMLGTRRAGINEAVRELTDAGAIEHHRNRVRIIDRKRLEELSCECYEVIVQEFEVAMGYSPRRAR
jgi:CRP-like cAMP-binding protein